MAKCLRIVTVITQVQTSHRLQLEFKILQGSLRIKLDFFSVTTGLKDKRSVADVQYCVSNMSSAAKLFKASCRKFNPAEKY